MIGLKRHTVLVAEYEPRWAEQFAAEAGVLRESIGDLVEDIQHVGSTSVPGLPAKPILDISVAVESSESIPLIGERLLRVGYINRGDQGESGGYLFVKESAPEVRTVHLHIVERDDVQWRNYLGFRDALRADESLKNAYMELKRNLARRFPDDRIAYTAGKNEFIQGILHQLAQ